MNNDKLVKQRIYRKKVNNLPTRKYEKTPNGFLVRLYRNMRSRTMGVQKQKFHLYRGLSLLPKEEFYQWAKGSEMFWTLWNEWVKNSFDRKLTPSVDRVNPYKGYEISNMEWVTHSENSRRGSLSNRRYSPN